MDVNFTVRGFGNGKYILEGPDGRFIERSPAELGVDAPPGGSYLDDSLRSNYVPQQSSTESSGLGAALERGVYEAADIGGATLRFFGAEDTGRGLSDWAKERASALPVPETNMEKAASMLPSSMAFPMAMQLGSYPAAFVPVVGPALSMVMKGLAWSYPALMGTAQYQQTKEAAIEKGVDPGAAPLITGGAETAFEVIPMMMFSRFLPFAPVLRSLGQTAGREITKMPLRELGKRAGLAIGTDVSGEMATSYIQGSAEKSYGIRPEADPFQEMIDVAGPSAILSVGTAGLVGGGARMTSNMYNRILESPAKEDSNFQLRKDVRRISAASITDAIGASGDKEAALVAKKWHDYAMQQIDNNLPIDMDSPILDVVNKVHTPIDLTKPREVQESAIGTPFSKVPEKELPLYDYDVADFMQESRHEAGPVYNYGEQPTYDYDINEVMNATPVEQPYVQPQAAITHDNVSGPAINIPEVGIPGAVPFWSGRAGQPIMNEPVNVYVREHVTAPVQPWYGANIDLGGMRTVPLEQRPMTPVAPAAPLVPAQQDAAPQVNRPLRPVTAEEPALRQLDPDDIPEERIPAILADFQDAIKKINRPDALQPMVRYLNGDYETPQGRQLFIAVLGNAGYEVPPQENVEQAYDKIAATIIGSQIRGGSPVPGNIPASPVAKAGVKAPLKKRRSAKKPSPLVPVSTQTTESPDATGNDYSSMSNADLLSAALGIVNEHIGKRGSFSLEKSGQKESLYVKLKPIFDELVKRAKQRAIDVEGYLFGWAHSQPDISEEGLSAIDDAIDNYLWDMETKDEPVAQEQVEENKASRGNTPWDVELAVSKEIKSGRSIEPKDMYELVERMLPEDVVVNYGKGFLQERKIPSDRFDRNELWAKGADAMFVRGSEMAKGILPLRKASEKEKAKDNVQTKVEVTEAVETSSTSPSDIAKKMMGRPANNRNEKSARKFIDDLKDRYDMQEAEKALNDFTSMPKWEAGKTHGLKQAEYAKKRKEAWEAIAKKVGSAKQILKVNNKKSNRLKAASETVNTKGTVTKEQEPVKTAQKETVSTESNKKVPLTFKQWIEETTDFDWDTLQHTSSETKNEYRLGYEAYRDSFTNAVSSPKAGPTASNAGIKKQEATVTPSKSEPVKTESGSKEPGTGSRPLAKVLKVGMSADKLTEVWKKLVDAAKKSKMDAKTKEAIDVFMNDPKSAGYGSGEMMILIRAAGFKLDDNLNLKKIALQLKSAEGYKRLHETKTKPAGTNTKKADEVVAKVAEKEHEREKASAAEVALETETYEKRVKEILAGMAVKGLKVGAIVRYGLYYKDHRVNSVDYHTIEDANGSKKGEAQRIARTEISDKHGRDYDFIKSSVSGVTGFSVQNAKIQVDRLRNLWKGMPKVNIHGNFNSLPSFIRHDIIQQQRENAKAIAGFVYAGEVYLIANKIQNVADLEMIMAHEVVGHYGVEEILGDQFEPMMLGIYESFKNDARMKWLVDYNKTKNMDKDEGKINAAKEFVAELATGYRLDPPTLPRKILNAVRQFLRKFGFKTRWTDRDIERILASSYTHITTEPSRVYSGGYEMNSRGYSYMMKMPDMVQAMGSSENVMANAALAFGRTLRSFGPDKTESISYKEQYLASPEWFQHHVLKALFEIAMKRSDLFHENFHRYIAIKDKDGNDTGKNVLEMNKELTKISLWSRLKGKIDEKERKSIEKGKRWAKERDKIIDIMSVSDGTIKWDDWTDSKGIHHRGFKHEVASKFDREVYDMVDALRRSYDRVIDEKIAELKNMKKMLDEEEKATGIKVKRPMFPSYNEKGEAIYLTLDHAIEAFGNWRGSYAPRIRTGRYVFVAARTVDGKRELWREQGNSKTKLNYIRIQMQKAGWDCEEVEAVERLPEVINASLRYVDIQALIDKSFARMEKEKNREGGDFSPTQKEMMYMMHGDMIMAIRDELLSRGFRAHGIKRRSDVLIGGYEMDALKQAVTYFANFASGKAKIETAKQMAAAIKPRWENGKYVEGVGIVPQKDPKTWIVAHKYIQHQLRNADDLDRIINRAKQIISVKYLGFSLRAPIVNMTSLVITAPSATYSILTDAGIKVGFTDILPALKNGMATYTKFMIDHYSGKKSTWSKDNVTDRTNKKFLDQMTKSGWDNQQFTSAAMGGITSTTLGNAFDNSVSFCMGLFGKSEQLIRGTVLYAGFSLAAKARGLYDMQEGSGEYNKTFEECCKLAEKCSLRANAAYNRPSDPLWAMGDHPMAKMGQLYYMYMKFPHNFLQLLYHTGIRKKQYKAAAWLLAAPVALSGAVTFPFYNTLAAFAGMMLRAFLGEDRDPEKLMREKLESMFGKEPTSLLLGGVLGKMGMDISGSLSVGIEKPTKWTDAFGVMGGAVGDVQEALRQLSVGNYMRAFAKLTPNFASSNLKNVIEREGGVMTDKAQPLFDERGLVVKPTAGEQFLRMVTGTEPFRIAEIKRRTYQGKKQLMTMKGRRDKLMEEYRLYWSGVRKDPEYLSEIMKDIREYNRKVLKYGGSKRTGMASITPESLRTQREKFTKTNRKALQLFYENP